MKRLKEIRCERCNKLLLKLELTKPYAYEIKCPRCGEMNVSEEKDKTKA